MLALSAASASAQTPPAPPAPAAPATPPVPAPAPAADSINQLSENKVVAVLGLAVRGNDNKEVGRIVDVLVDETGKPRAAVIDVGGFLGMGSRKVAVDWTILHFLMGKAAAALLSVSSTSIKSAPAYDPAQPVQAVGLPEPPPALPPTSPPTEATPAPAPAPAPPPASASPASASPPPSQ